MSNLSASLSSTILLVDDEPDILRSLQLILKPEGYRIDVTSTGAGALEAIKEHPYDVVILDIGLPDMDGLLVMGKMTGYRPDLPIIILTSFTSLESVTGPLEDQGAFAYLHKPIITGCYRPSTPGRSLDFHRGLVGMDSIHWATLPHTPTTRRPA